MHLRPFSILERIELGETLRAGRLRGGSVRLSVSSNGSNWVKQYYPAKQRQYRRTFSILERIELGETNRENTDVSGSTDFQYPRTDRIG